MTEGPASAGRSPTTTGSGPSVAAVVLTYNQRELTLGLLETLVGSAAVPLYVLVWDNGSADDTVGAVQRAYPAVLARWSEANLGVAGGRNAAARLAIETWAPTHLLFLDNDLELEPGFVDALLDVFQRDDQVGQAQAKLRFMHDRSRLNDGGGCQINFLTGQTVPVGFGEVDRGQHDTVRPCVSCGGAMMVRADVFQDLGGFDLTFNPFGPEDLDFSLRLQRAGYRALFVPTAVAYHLVSHTYGAGYSEDYARHKARHWLTFLGRHGSLAQKLGFYLLGAPYMAVRVALREVRRGNPGALRGVARGLLDALTGRRRSGT